MQDCKLKIKLPGPTRATNTKWEAPDEYWTKLNCDAAFDRDACRVEVAGVWRDNNGRWLFGLCAGTIATNVLWAELLAIKMGLEECIKRNMTKIIIHTDSSVAVELLKRDANTNNSLFTLIVECREKTMTFNELKIELCFREGNKVVDSCAKLALSGFCLHMDSHILMRPSDVCFNLLISRGSYGGD